MSQHDYVINNDSGASVRADINSVLQAILSSNSGTSAPTSTSAGTLWLDTTGGAPYTLKIRDAGNNHWLTIGSVTDPGADGGLELLPGKINLPSTGGIYESDGSTAVLTESSGAVTLDNVSLGSSVSLPANQGSSMVLIKKVDISGTPSSVIFDNSDSDVTFDTTYDNYVFYLSNIIPTDNNVSFYTKLRTNGSDQSSTVFGGSSAYYDNNAGGSGNTQFDFYSLVFTLPEVHHNETNGGISATITLYKPADNTITTSSTISWIYYRSNNYVYTGSGGTRIQAQTLINGIKFYWGGSSGTFKNVGTISMYGVKNA